MTNKEMNWKSWPQWKKGGIIGSIIYVVMVLMLVMNVAPLWVAILTLAYLPLAFLLVGILNTLGLHVQTEVAVLLSYLCMVVAGYMIGATVGWIYGKIKDRKSLSA